MLNVFSSLFFLLFFIILIIVFTYFLINKLLKENENPKIIKEVDNTKWFRAEVIDISEDKLEVIVSKLTNDDNSRTQELIFEITRVNNPKNISIGDCYLMIDSNIIYGESTLMFVRYEPFDADYEKELNERLDEIGNSKSFYQID